MVIVDGWLDWAVRRPGPPQKVYQTTNGQRGLVCHSAEGYNASNFHELDNPNRAASWHCTNSLDGTFYQHYPFSASCWASGNYEANTRFVAVESEGVHDVDGPLNDLQVANMLRLVQDLPFFPVRKSTLWEHNEVATMWSPNAGPTACPSHRYDPFFAALLAPTPTPEDPMEPERLSLFGVASGDYDRMNTAHKALADAGLVPGANFTDDLNGAVVRRFEIINVASGPKAQEAYVVAVTALGGTP